MPHARGPNIILNNYQSACGLPFILSSAGPPPPSTWVPQALLHPDHRAETWPDTWPRHSASSEHESYIPRGKRHPANSTLHTSMGSHKAGPHSDKHREDSWDWNPLCACRALLWEHGVQMESHTNLLPPNAELGEESQQTPPQSAHLMLHTNTN